MDIGRLFVVELEHLTDTVSAIFPASGMIELLEPLMPKGIALPIPKWRGKERIREDVEMGEAPVLKSVSTDLGQLLLIYKRSE